MSEQEAEQPQLPLVGVGPRLKAAREAMGISREGIAQKTRIAERLVIEIEAGNWDAMPSRTYATGFTRSYARAVGLNEADIVTGVRREMGLSEPAEQHTSAAALEPGDPARVPGKRFALWLALLALAVAIGGYFAWRTLYAPALVLPPILPEESASANPAMTTEATAPAFDASLSADATFAPTESADQAFNPAPQRRAAPRESRRSAPQPDARTVLPSPPVAVPAPITPQPAPPPTPSTVSN